MGGFVGASFSPEAPPADGPTIMRFQSVDDVAYTVTDSYDADTELIALQVCVLWVCVALVMVLALMYSLVQAAVMTVHHSVIVLFGNASCAGHGGGCGLG
jgi:hypothetical protein